MSNFRPQQQQQQQQHNQQQQQQQQPSQHLPPAPTQPPSQQQQPTTYNAERIVGSGSFGVVYQARVVLPDGTPGEQVAIKRVYLDPDFKNRELQIMSELDHPSVVSLKHCFYTQHEQGKTYLNLVMPFLPDSIHRTIRSHSRARVSIPIDRVRRYIYQIIRGLAYIHDVGICHRDLKPQNVLINEQNSDVRICDFGSAKKLSPEESNVSYICSRYYRAPELALGARMYTSSVDVWSAGCVFAELLTGKPLFPGETSDDQILRIISILGMPQSDDYCGMGVDENKSRRLILDALNKFRVTSTGNNGTNGGGVVNGLNNGQSSTNNTIPQPYTPEYNIDNLNIQGQGLFRALALNPSQHLSTNNNNNNPLNQHITQSTNVENDLLSIQKDITNVIDLLTQMLKFNPKNRIGAFKALAHPFFDKIHHPEWDDLPQSTPSMLSSNNNNMNNNTIDQYQQQQQLLVDTTSSLNNTLQPHQYYSWEIQQHCWTEREAALIHSYSQADPQFAAILLPLWCRHYVGKRIQSIAQRDLDVLYQQKHQQLRSSNNNGNNIPITIANRGGVQQQQLQQMNQQQSQQTKDISLVFDPVSRSYAIQPVPSITSSTPAAVNLLGSQKETLPLNNIAIPPQSHINSTIITTQDVLAQKQRLQEENDSGFQTLINDELNGNNTIDENPTTTASINNNLSSNNMLNSSYTSKFGNFSTKNNNNNNNINSTSEISTTSRSNNNNNNDYKINPIIDNSNTLTEELKD